MINFNLIISFYLFFLVICLSFFMLCKYYNSLLNQERYTRYLLICFRSLSVILFLVILLQPVVSLTETVTENKEITIFIDNSRSMSYSLKNNNFKDQLNLVTEKLQNNNIDFNFYLFGDSIRKINRVSEIHFTDQVTNLNQISEVINYLNSSEYILISDGMQNQGMIDFTIGDNTLVNSFAVGSLYKEEDLSIDTLIVSSVNENNINVKCKISSKINYNYENIRINISNDKVANKILTYINISENNPTFFYNFTITKSDLSNNNIIYIDHIASEFNTDNNYYNFILDSDDLYKKRILLFSGRLSQNTKYIKNLIQEYSNLELIHFHEFSTFNLQSFNSIEYDAVIFDSFPITAKNLSIINQNNILENKSMGFFQGPSAGNDYTFYNKFLLDWGYNFISDNKDDLQTTSLYSNNNNSNLYKHIINEIVPINIDKRILNNKRESTFYDDKNNTIIDYNNNNLFVFIPNLTKISNETLNIYKNDNLKFLIHSFLQKVIFGIDKDRVKIYTNKDTYYVDEKFNLYVNIDNININYNDIDIYIYNKDGSIQSKVTKCNFSLENLYICSGKIDHVGDYFIQAKVKSENNFNIQSNQINITFTDLDAEIKNIGLNKEILENIALNYNGGYYELEELNDHIDSIKSDTSSELKLREILIFNFQSFWFVIILFLIVEWIFRKNKGLL